MGKDDSAPTSDKKDDSAPTSEKKDDSDPTSDKKDDSAPTTEKINDSALTSDKKHDSAPTSDKKDGSIENTVSVASTVSDMISPGDSIIIPEEKKQSMENVISMVSMVSQVIPPAHDISEIENKEDNTLKTDGNEDNVSISENIDESLEKRASIVSIVSHAFSPAEKSIKSEVSSKAEKEEEDALASDHKEETSGVLQVTVVEATDLVNKDKIGKSDPYVVVKFQDQQFRSSTVKNSLSPKWNFLSSFKVSSDEVDSIQFCVYDDDVHKADEPLGSISVDIPDAISEAKNPRWFDLKGCKTGKLAVSFEFIEKANEDEQKDTSTLETEQKTNGTSSDKLVDDNEQIKAKDAFINDIYEEVSQKNKRNCERCSS